MVYICPEPSCNKKVLKVDVKKHAKMHKMEKIQQLMHGFETGRNTVLSLPAVTSIPQEELIPEEEEDSTIVEVIGNNDDTENRAVEIEPQHEEEMIEVDMFDCMEDIVYDDASIPNPIVDNDFSITLESSPTTSNKQTKLAVVNQILLSLKRYRDSIVNPIEVSLVGVASEEQNVVEKASINFRNELRQRKVAKHTTEFIYGFFNRYLDEIGNGRFKLMSPYQCDKMLNVNVNSLEPKDYRMCPNGCYLFYDGDVSAQCQSTNSKNCNQPSRTNSVSHKQLPLAKQLAYFLISGQNMKKMDYYKNRGNNVGVYRDYFDGNAFATLVQKIPNFDTTTNVFLAMYVDGYQPFQYAKQSQTIIMFSILNLPPDERYKKENILVVDLTPGKNKPDPIFSFLHPIMQDLLVLESEGMRIHVPGADEDKYHIRAFLSLCIGDTPAMAELSLHSGHMSKKGCRICPTEGGRIPNKRGIYFVPNLSTHTPERNYDDYAGANDDTGIMAPIPLTLLQSFHNASSLGLDEMHLWGMNIGKQLLCIISDDPQVFGSNNPLYLRRSYRAEMERSLENVKTLDGDVKDLFGRPKRAVDYIDFLCIVAPTVYNECLKSQANDMKEKLEKTNTIRRRRNEPEEIDIATNVVDEACEAVASLARACRICQQFNITSAELSEIERCIDIWHRFLLNHLRHNVFTISQHYLRHIPFIIREMGPLRLISSRVQERMIKILKDQINSTSHTAANTATVLRNHYSLSFRTWNTSNNEEILSSSQISLDILDELYPAARIVDFFSELRGQPVDDLTTFENLKRFRCANGQIVHQKRNSTDMVIVKNNNDVMLYYDAIFQLYYYDHSSELGKYEVIATDTVVSGSISLVPSLVDSNKTIVFWKD